MDTFLWITLLGAFISDVIGIRVLSMVFVVAAIIHLI